MNTTNAGTNPTAPTLRPENTPRGYRDAMADRLDRVTRVRPTAGPRTTPGGPTTRLLRRLGIQLTPSGDGSAYGPCPLGCDSWHGLAVEADGRHWRLVCGCRPARDRFDQWDLMAELAGIGK